LGVGQEPLDFNERHRSGAELLHTGFLYAASRDGLHLRRHLVGIPGPPWHWRVPVHVGADLRQGGKIQRCGVVGWGHPAFQVLSYIERLVRLLAGPGRNPGVGVGQHLRQLRRRLVNHLLASLRGWRRRAR
jgi:hypothetical protein